MKPMMYAMSVETCAPVLRSLSAVLDKAAAHAEAKKIDPSVFVNARLAPDMFALARQIQIATDHAKGSAARLSGQEVPKYEDNETTLDDLKARIAKTVAYLEGMSPAAFEGAEERHIKMPLMPGMELDANGLQYLRDWVLPHFYFHVVTAYDILRHNGVEIGKRDFLGHAAAIIKQTGN